MKIKYVGVKQDGETAFSRETGITWFPGTSEDVPVALATKMLNHPDVFAEDNDAATAPAAPAAPVTLQPMAKAAIDPATSVITPTADPLEALSRAELHALAKERGVVIHHSSGAAAVLKAIQAAATEKAA